MKAFYFDGENGEIVREEEIPADLVEAGEDGPPRHDRGASPTCDDTLAEKFI